ncbi:facilitated trehalose transporter Tret1-like [Condylostylus longicornis]|uniref:facilitated trehalose transporter Tret1-like n=1 Tax=Condylostylus longicornis TaxID=2530218 RepID=UPI00244DD55F|nr:facilitated trehalose transporter Tret1-like [Condylostylus longicornis]
MFAKVNKNNEEEARFEKTLPLQVSNFRRILPQESMYFESADATCFGSIYLIILPIGTIISGYITEATGRRTSLIICCIPLIIGWLICYLSTNILMLFIGDIFLGFGTGLMEPPIIAYVAESSQESVRGILISLNSITVTLGIYLTLFLQAMVSWRILTLIGMAFAIVGIFVVFLIPESPLWLISKNRYELAMKNLQCLRGCVAREAVKDEFEKMKMYVENANKCQQCSKENIECLHPKPTIMEKIKSLNHKKYRRLFLILIELSIVSYLGGYLTLRPFLFQVLSSYAIPIEIKKAVAYIGTAQVLANILNTFSLKILGKRHIYFIGIVGNILCCIYLATFGAICFPENYYSNAENQNQKLNYESCSRYFTFFIFYMLIFFTSYGVAVMPWILVGEITPINYKGFVVGTFCAIFYYMNFIGHKSYLYIEWALTLNGIMWFFLTINIIGLVFAYFFLFETEGHSLNEIEDHLMYTSYTNTKIQKARAIEN